MSKQVGKFKVEVWRGGSPIWVVLEDDSGARMQFTSDELHDLEYAVSAAKREVQEQLNAQRRNES